MNYMFTLCTKMNENNNIYGLNTNDNITDPHLMKNSEWGAVAYLSQSIYGKNSEVWKNPTFITGHAGDTVDATSNWSGNDISYYTLNGQEASTTGNISGIYDISGGVDECMASYIEGTSFPTKYLGYAGELVEADEKYKDVYIIENEDTSIEETYNIFSPSSGRFGDALWEITSTSNNSQNYAWYNDYFYLTSSNSGGIISRGGNLGNGGIFYMPLNNMGIWDGTIGYFGFRVTIAVY